MSGGGAMQVNVKSKNLVLTEALKDYAKKKLSRLQKYSDQILSADVMLITERSFHIVEATVHVNGLTLRGEEKTGDMYSSIDQVIDKLERQIRKHKEKLKNHHRVKEQEVVPLAAEPAAPRIRLKKQRVSDLTPEEAAYEMKRLGYSFFLFQNRETENLNLIYKAENGNLALLEPVVR